MLFRRHHLTATEKGRKLSTISPSTLITNAYSSNEVHRAKAPRSYLFALLLLRKTEEGRKAKNSFTEWILSDQPTTGKPCAGPPVEAKQ